MRGAEPGGGVPYERDVKRLAIALLFGASATVLFLNAAQTPRAARSPDRLASLSVEPVIDMQGTFIACVVTAKFHSIDAKPNGEVDSHPSGSVQFDLCAVGDVMVGDTVYDGREISAILAAAAMKEWAKANPQALPTRRRAVRSP